VRGEGPAELPKMVRLLEDLQDTSAGKAIYDKLGQVLQDWNDSRIKLDRAYSMLLSFSLDLHLKNPDDSTADGISSSIARLQETSMPPGFADQTSDLTLPDKSPTGIEQKISDLVEGLKTRNEAVVRTPETGQTQKPIQQETGGETIRPAPESETGGETVRPAPESETGKEKQYPGVERRVNSAYRLHLDRKHDEIEKFQEILSQKASEAITQNKEFGALLEIELSALQQASGGDEINNLKQILIGGTKELIKGQRALADKLVSTRDYMELVKTDSVSLRDELDKVRLLSLTDEFTNLPNRRAFMRRLEDEIGRAQRYQTPLALAIIDLDKFKAINDKHGHAAGDEVLRWYSQNVLSIFRHHDMVARYGGEEFSVLLPNTDGEGALRALNKVRGRATNATWEFEDKLLPAPTFSAGLTLYVPGEPPNTIIDRADKALYRAKRLGRNRIETEMPKARSLDEINQSSNG